MKKNTALILGIAAAAVYFLFLRKPVSQDANVKNQLTTLVDSLDETADYKTYFKSQIPQMTGDEVRALISFIQSGRVEASASPIVVQTYQKYMLGS